jgi:predicted DNA binding CopG/RHH family protein
MSENQKANTNAATVSKGKGQRKKAVRKKSSVASETSAKKKTSSSTRKTSVRAKAKAAIIADKSCPQTQPKDALVEQNPPLEERFFHYENADNHAPETFENQTPAPEPDANTIIVTLSQSLIKKIKQQAEDEGISVNDFASELLSEGVVLRAWEILERKNQLRGSSSQSNHSHNHSNRSQQNRGSGGRQKGNRGGMSHGRYQAIMDDKATFLEYVRNQERSRR